MAETKTPLSLPELKQRRAQLAANLDKRREQVKAMEERLAKLDERVAKREAAAQRKARKG